MSRLFTDRTQTFSFGAANAELRTPVGSAGGARLDIRGTFVGTVVVEGTMNGGTNWLALNFLPGGAFSGFNPIASATAVGNFLLSGLSGFTDVRVRCSAYTSGTITGTFTLTEDAHAVAVAVNGTAAHGSTISGNPVRGGARAVTANPTAVTTGQTADLISTLVGVQINKLFSIPNLDWQYAGPVAGLTTAADTAAKAAGAAGIKNYVTGMTVQNNSATATEFQVKDNATVIWRCLCPANMPVTNIQFPTPLQGTAATVLNVQAVTAASVVICCLQGYQAP